MTQVLGYKTARGQFYGSLTAMPVHERPTAIALGALNADVGASVRMRLEIAHRLLTNATGPSGASAALHEIAEAIKVIDGAPTQRLSDALRAFIEGMSVSVDVSTGEADSGHRYFGTVTEVMDDPEDKHGVTLLVQDATPNFACRDPQ